MLPCALGRHLLVVPLAENNHGKTTILKALYRQGTRVGYDKPQRGVRNLVSPWGRAIDTLFFPRSYQETLRGEFGSVEASLNAIDPNWAQRDLIILPSHLVPADCSMIIGLGHGAGFDTVAVPIVLSTDDLASYRDCLSLAWNERWTLSNTAIENPGAQLEAFGHDLWTWVSGAIERR